MAGHLDLRVDRGTTYRVSFVWGEEDDNGTMVPFNLTDCTARFLVLASGYYYSQSFPATIDVETSEVYLELSAYQTESLPARGEYAFEVTFPSGDVSHALEGTLILNHGKGLR